MYPPAMSADRDELVAIGRAVARHDRLFAIHMRNYSDDLLDAVTEALAVARASGCRLQVSHLAVAGRRNWGTVPRALELIEAARADGVDVAVDIYPYIAGSANLSQLLPVWAQAGGPAAIVERLSSAEERRKIREDWRDSLFFGWDEIEVSSSEPGLEETLGLTVQAVAEGWSMDPNETALDLIARSDNRVQMVAYGRSEDDLRAVLTHPLTSIGSDGLAMDPDGPSSAGRPHPRSFGCYPRLLGRYVRDAGLLTLERAVEMSTSRPADRAGLTDRGRIVEGAIADLVVFDPDAIIDAATFREPTRRPVGIAGGRRGWAKSSRGRAPARRQATRPGAAGVIEFGFAVPPGDREMGRVDPATFAADLDSLMVVAGRIFDSVWVSDHLMEGDRYRIEPWTQLTWLAARVPRVMLGHSVLANSYRHPALMAKMSASIQALSGGRFILGYGAGWLEDEYRAYGYPFPPTRERIARMDEALRLIKTMWTESPATFEGEFYSVKDAWCEPRPDPLPPIMIGGSGERYLLRAVAEHADWWLSYGDVPAIQERKLAALADHCRDVGRDPASIRKVVPWTVYLHRDRNAALRWAGDAVEGDRPAFAGRPRGAARPDRRGRRARLRHDPAPVRRADGHDRHRAVRRRGAAACPLTLTRGWRAGG